MRQIRELEPTEIRILGALLEKEQATPDYYPLTINAVIAACNQKSNRSPVTELSETEIVEALDTLRSDVLAWRSDGARSERWSQSISRRLELDPGEKAVLTLLMLRGPQTAGELRSRSTRLHAFSDLREVDATLHRLAEEDRELVRELARRRGQKETRWAHRLGAAIEEPGPAVDAVTAGSARRAAGDRIGRLEERVRELEAVVEALKRELGVDG